MRSIKTIMACACVAASLFASPANALAEDDTTFVTTFSTLTEGMASVSLIWTLHAGSLEQSLALQALLSAKVNSPTDDISTRESLDFRAINNIDYSIDATPNQLIFTMQAPQENFDAGVEHLAEMFAFDGIDPNWLKRQNHAFRPISATRLRTPETLEAELVSYVNFQADSPRLNNEDLQNEVLRSPNHLIMNGREFDFGNTPDVLLARFEPFDAVLNNTPVIAHRQLPKGTIHLADPESSETLIFMGQAHEFETLEQQALTDTIFKYMGYGPGSEMFRIVRQEKRASYDPRSHFTQIGEQRAITGLSATVPSEKWPEIHGVIAQIYNDARAGKNTDQGLNNSHNSMLNSIVYDLRRDPNWIIKRFLEVHPHEPPAGQIMLDLLDASFEMNPNDINPRASEILPSAENLLNVIIGGAITPTEEMRKNGYCALPEGKPLAYCLDILATEQK